METFDRTGLENIPTILNQLNSLTVGEKFRFAAKHKDLAGKWFPATASKCDNFFEIKYDDPNLGTQNIYFDDEKESLVSENLWSKGWFGILQEEQNTASDRTVQSAYAFEGKSISLSLKGEKYVLHQTVKFLNGPNAATWSAKDLCFCTSSACTKDLVIFYHAAVSEMKPTQAVIYNTAIMQPAFVLLESLSVPDATTTLPADFNINRCHESVKSFLKSMMEEKNNKEDEIYERERVQTEQVEKSDEFHTDQEVQQHTRKKSVDIDEHTDRSVGAKRVVRQKQKFSPDQKGVRVTIKQRGETKKIALGRLMQNPAATTTVKRQRSKNENRMKKARKDPDEPSVNLKVGPPEEKANAKLHQRVQELEAQLESLKQNQQAAQKIPNNFAPWPASVNPMLAAPVFPKTNEGSSSETIQAMKLMLASQHMGFMSAFYNSL